MSTQKRKFELFSRLQNLGFTYDESCALRRIEMTLSRWSERECGDGSDWAIERAEPRKLAICHDPKFTDGLRVVALDYHGRFVETVKHLPAHLKQDTNPDVFPAEAIAILARLQQRENEIEGKPFNVYHGEGKPRRYPIADREAGALRRLQAIVNARNDRDPRGSITSKTGTILWYHQGDPRGCSLYLVPVAELEKGENQIVAKAEKMGLVIQRCERSEPTKAPQYMSPQFERQLFDTPESIARKFLKIRGEEIPSRLLPIDQYYTRGVAVCA